MKAKRHTEAEIFNILKEAESGVPVATVIHQHGISRGTFYQWKSRYGGMDVNELKRLKQLEEENRKLKQMFANVCIERDALKDILSKKW